LSLSKRALSGKRFKAARADRENNEPAPGMRAKQLASGPVAARESADAKMRIILVPEPASRSLVIYACPVCEPPFIRPQQSNPSLLSEVWPVTAASVA